MVPANFDGLEREEDQLGQDRTGLALYCRVLEDLAGLFRDYFRDLGE